MLSRTLSIVVALSGAVASHADATPSGVDLSLQQPTKNACAAPRYP